MKANEAFRLSRNYPKFKTVLPAIMKKIECAAMSGDTSCVFELQDDSNDMNDYVTKHLLDLDYSVRRVYHDGRNSGYFRGWEISWEGPC